jgi:hypothetical protein
VAAYQRPQLEDKQVTAHVQNTKPIRIITTQQPIGANMDFIILNLIFWPIFTLCLIINLAAHVFVQSLYE